MTKEETLVKHLPRGIYLDDVYQAANELQNSIPDAMDEYAKQEAIEFITWYARYWNRGQNPFEEYENGEVGIETLTEVVSPEELYSKYLQSKIK